MWEFYLLTYCKCSFSKKLPQQGYFPPKCSKYVLLLHCFIPIRIQKRSDKDAPHYSLGLKVISQLLWQVNKDIFRKYTFKFTQHRNICHIHGLPYFYSFKNNIFFLLTILNQSRVLVLFQCIFFSYFSHWSLLQTFCISL